MKALIDSDIFQWEFGNATDAEFKAIPWPFVQSRIQGRIDKIVEETGADGYQLYITSDDGSNFRYKVATIKPYKGNRKDIEKPYWYTHIRNFLVDHRGAIEVFGQEADDALSLAQYKDLSGTFLCLKDKDMSEDTTSISGYEDSIKDRCETVICSKDKDLLMVPGYHYNWSKPEEGVWWQDELDGLRCFYKQLLTGDTVDNIPGLFGVGNSSAFVKQLDSLNDEDSMFKHVFKQYENRFGSYAEKFITENGQLLWMRKTEGEMWSPPCATHM